MRSKGDSIGILLWAFCTLTGIAAEASAVAVFVRVGNTNRTAGDGFSAHGYRYGAGLRKSTEYANSLWNLKSIVVSLGVGTGINNDAINECSARHASLRSRWRWRPVSHMGERRYAFTPSSRRVRRLTI